jgi:hypothetical protein
LGPGCPQDAGRQLPVGVGPPRRVAQEGAQQVQRRRGYCRRG